MALSQSHTHTHTKKKNVTKCDVKVMTHLNFGTNNGKPAAVTSWGLGDVGGKLRLGGGGGNLSLGEGSCPPQHLPNDAPEVKPSSLEELCIFGYCIHPSPQFLPVVPLDC